jgi:hypothetical protein
LFIFRDSEPFTGLARAASSSCESSSSCKSAGSWLGTLESRACLDLELFWQAGATEVPETTILFEFVVRLMAVDDREVGAEQPGAGDSEVAEVVLILFL